MASLGNFNKGDRVWVAESPSDWIGVELLDQPGGGERIRVKIVFTNGSDDVPRYTAGQEVVLIPDIHAHRELGVNALIGSRGER